MSDTDITSVFLYIYDMLLNYIITLITTADHIILLNYSVLGFDVSLLDFWIGVTVLGLILGGFYMFPKLLNFDFGRELYR